MCFFASGKEILSFVGNSFFIYSATLTNLLSFKFNSVLCRLYEIKNVNYFTILRKYLAYENT